MAMKDRPALGLDRAGHFVPLREHAEECKWLKGKIRFARTWPVEKNASQPPPGASFNSCNAKSVWYYITGVNVHVKFISFFSLRSFFYFEDIFMLRSFNQVSRKLRILLCAGALFEAACAYPLLAESG